MFFTSAGSTYWGRRMARFRFADFEVKMCRWNARFRLSLPVPLFLNRFAAPRLVFIFGISDSLKLGFLKRPARPSHGSANVQIKFLPL